MFINTKHYVSKYGSEAIQSQTSYKPNNTKNVENDSYTNKTKKKNILPTLGIVAAGSAILYKSKNKIKNFAAKIPAKYSAIKSKLPKTSNLLSKAGAFIKTKGSFLKTFIKTLFTKKP